MKLLKKPKAGAPTVNCKRSWVQKTTSRIFFASFLLATVLPVSKVWAQTGYDVTLSGEELLGQPDVVFHETPNIVGTSIDMLSVGESFLFEWSLLPPQTRGPVLVRATIDYTPMTSDNDPTIGIHDGINQVGYLRSDNVGGSLFKREGIVNGITLPSPPLGPFGPQDLDPVETFEMSFFVPGDGNVPTSFEFLEEGDFFRDEFENFTIDADAGLTLFWGGGTNGETYRLHAITVQVAVASSIAEGLAYFPVPNCRIAKTDKSAAGRLERYETREYVVRGETRNLGSQGGSDNGCGIPREAEAIVANFWLFSHDGNGRLRAGATDQNLGSNILINYSELTVESYTNSTVVNLCRNNVCPNDFQVNVEGAASGTHLAIDVAGYFAPSVGASRSLSFAENVSVSDLGVSLREQLKELELRNHQVQEELEQIKALLGIDGSGRTSP